MRTSIAKFVTASLLILFSSPTIAVETLRIGGTGGAMGLMQKVAAVYPDAKLQVISPALGSSGAIRAVANNDIAMAFSARTLTAAEEALGLVAVAIARTPFVFVTSMQKPNSLKSDDLPKIYTSPDAKWADGTPLRVILRTRGDADNLIFENYFPGMREALDVARRRSEIPVTATDQDNARTAERIAGSLTTAGFSQIETEKRDLRYVPIDGVPPSLENLANHKYPYTKVFFLIYGPSNKAAAQSLRDFLRSEKGRVLLRETGNLPVNE